MTEFDLIALFTRGAPRAGEGVRLGIGDDAALLRPPAGEDLVMTVDAVVEGVHFDGGFSPAEVGWKALAVNLSDLAAMGARPLWALCALATPPDATRRLAGVGRGLARCARVHGIALVGGNVTRAESLSLTVTVVGAVQRGAGLRRSGGRAGDLLLVSGTLGDAALGLMDGATAPLLRRQRTPTPRLALGQALGGLARAGLDVSDGLLQDLGHLCAASGTGAVVRADLLPLSRAARRAFPPPRVLEAALGGGEDYELLVAVRPGDAARAEAVSRRVGVPLTRIGELVPGRSVKVVDGAGRAHRAARQGHDHLAAEAKAHIRRLDGPGGGA